MVQHHVSYERHSLQGAWRQAGDKKPQHVCDGYLDLRVPQSSLLALRYTYGPESTYGRYV